MHLLILSLPVAFKDPNTSLNPATIRFFAFFGWLSFFIAWEYDSPLISSSVMSSMEEFGRWSTQLGKYKKGNNKMEKWCYNLLVCLLSKYHIIIFDSSKIKFFIYVSRQLVDDHFGALFLHLRLKNSIFFVYLLLFLL